MRLLIVSFLLIAMILSGCNSTDKSNSIDIETALIEGGSVTGYVYEGDSLEIVDAPSSISSNAVPVANAVVKAITGDNRVVAMALSANNGYFRLINVPVGSVNLTIETTTTGNKVKKSPIKDLKKQNKTTTLSIQVVSGFDTSVNKSYPIERQTAIDIITPHFVTGDIVAMTLSPLPAGSILQDGSESGFRLILNRDVWFVMMNALPFLQYDHEIRYALIDANTASLDIGTLASYPVINGAPLWANSQDLYEINGYDSSQPENLDRELTLTFKAEIIRVPEELKGDIAALSKFFHKDDTQRVASQTLVAKGENDGLFALLIQGSNDVYLYQDLTDMETWLMSNGVPKENIALVPPSSIFFTKTFANSKKRFSEARAALAKFSIAMAKRKVKQLPSTLLVFSTGHGSKSSTKIQFAQKNIVPQQFLLSNTLDILSTPACDIQVILNHCYSEKWGRTLLKTIAKKNPKLNTEVQVFTAADSKNETSYYPLSGGVYTDKVISQAKINASGLSTFIFNLATFPATSPRNIVDGKVLAPLLNLTHPSKKIGFFTYEEVPNNPKAIRYRGNLEKCLAESVDKTLLGASNSDTESKPASFKFENFTDESATVVVVNEGQVLNNGEAIKIGVAGTPEATIKLEIEGGTKGIELLDFTVPNASIPNVGKLPAIIEGDSLKLNWLNKEGVRFLTID